MVTTEQIDQYLALFSGDATKAIQALNSRVQNKQALPTHSVNSDKKSVIISISSLTKSFKVSKQHINAINNVSFDIYEGEFVALTGASGSGKSTLLQLIAGLDKPTSGQIIVDGININKLHDGKLSTFRNKTIGFVFQFFYLQPFLKLTPNVELPGMFAHRQRKERRVEVQKLLGEVRLAERADHYPKELSGGQTQRAAIARALLNNPKILLADEPTGNLDSANSQEIIDLFHRIRDERNMTVVVVTHNPEIAAGADREIKLSDGVIV
jgi:ABC-type lipoprotein export system ATPase subunit